MKIAKRQATRSKVTAMSDEPEVREDGSVVLVPAKTVEPSYPVFDGDVMLLRGLCNRQGLVLPSGQAELRASISRVLDKFSRLEAVLIRLREVIRGVEQARREVPIAGYENVVRVGYDPDAIEDALHGMDDGNERVTMTTNDNQ